MASDGVWEFLENEDVVKRIKENYSDDRPSKSCEAIIEDSLRLWNEVVS